MTTPSSPKPSRWKTYGKDLDSFYQRHPVAQFVFTFSLLFTIWSLLQLVMPLSASLSSRSHIVGAAFYAAFVTVGVVLLQRWKQRRGSSRRDSEPVI
jgi:hypothetical protein